MLKNTEKKIKKKYLYLSKIYKNKHRQRYRVYQKEYYKNNKENRKRYIKSYREKNKTEINRKFSIYERERKKKDPLFKLKKLIKSKILTALKGKSHKKKNSSKDILSCSYEEFKSYLESKFEFWMNWDNHGLWNGEFNFGWDIDHIIPISSAITEDDVLKLNHYSNLQPLCSHINRYIKKNEILQK